MLKPVRYDRLHGRHEAKGRLCHWHDCEEPGEFRAPGPRAAGFDGPGEHLWFCLEHVREFNSGYDFFEGMSSAEIFHAQSPLRGWDSESRAFQPTAGVDGAPRWADFSDPLDAIGARAREIKNGVRRSLSPEQRKDGKPVSAEERRALGVMGLPIDAGRKDLRSRYAQLLRKYHPDHNGGDRGYETRLRQVVEAYQLLRGARAFA